MTLGEVALKAIIAMSGGIDSAVSLGLLKEGGGTQRALFLDFDKESSEQELAAAKYACLMSDTPLEIVDVSGLKKMQAGYVSSYHLRSDEMDIKGVEIVPGTPISGFNVLMSVSLYYAQLVNFDAVAFGIIKEQSAGRPRVFEMGRKLAQAQKYLNPAAPSIEFLFPLEAMEKHDVVAKGAELGLELDRTWSCIHGGLNHCGTCSQCASRKGAFQAARVKDPTLYEN